jgi:hypothetical protein
MEPSVSQKGIWHQVCDGLGLFPFLLKFETDQISPHNPTYGLKTLKQITCPTH